MLNPQNAAPICRNCRHFERDGQNTYGECRALPPHANGKAFGYFPIVSEQTHCGYFSRPESPQSDAV